MYLILFDCIQTNERQPTRSVPNEAGQEGESTVRARRHGTAGRHAHQRTHQTDRGAMLCGSRGSLQVGEKMMELGYDLNLKNNYNMNFIP